MNKRKLLLAAVSAIIILIVSNPSSGVAQNRQLPTITKPYPGGELPPFLDTALTTTAPLALEYQPSMAEGLLDWHQIVYQSYRDGNWEIYTSAGVLGSPINLTNNPAVDARPRINRLATRIVFNSNRDGNYEIYVINTDGSGLTRLTYNSSAEYAPYWSPNGDQIVYASEQSGTAEVYKMNSDGTSQTRLTYNNGLNGSPAWSPDGNQIAWVRYNDIYGAIWIMNADGSNQHAITGDWPYLGRPVWSPDGTRIAFDYDADGDFWNELTMINVDGTGLHTIYDPGGSYHDAWAGNWSLNGEVLLFTLVNYVNYGGNLYLESTYVMDVGPGNSTAYHVTHSGFDANPDLASLDPFPPISQVKPLPEYSRASGFQVAWSGYDQGPSGLYETPYQIEYRLGITGTWANLWGSSGFLGSMTSYPFSSPICDTVYFRSRARDNAENWEAWPPGDGDAWTRLFTWFLDGVVRDNRETPLVGAFVTLSPASLDDIETDVLGKYLARLSNKGTHSINANRNGYGERLNSSTTVEADSSYTLYLPPEDNITQNGNFEASDEQPTGWTIGGTFSATLTNGFSGSNAVRWGMNCPGPCLSDPEPFKLQEGVLYASSYPQLFIDNSGDFHLIWVAFDNVSYNHMLFYSHRTPQGDWDAPYPVGPAVAGGSQATEHDLVVDSQGTVHVIWYYGSVYYANKPSPGNWSVPIKISPGHVPAIATDNQTVIVTYSCVNNHYGCTSSGVFFLERLPSGIWLPSVQLDDGSGGGWSAVTIGSDHTVHFLYQIGSNPHQLVYRYRSPDGMLIPNYDVLYKSSLGRLGNVQIIIDGEGRLHAFGAINGTGIYFSRSSSGTWFIPETLVGAIYNGDMAIDSRGIIHFITARQAAGLYYYYKLPGVEWSDPYQIPIDFTECVTLQVDSQEDLHVIWAGYDLLYYQTSLRATEDRTESISQSVTIPEDMHQPTLDFMYQLDSRGKWSQSGFEVKITSGATVTQIYTSTLIAPWSHVWIDMSPWTGQTVTITFSLHQAANAPYIYLYLDDISLGSWQTPIVQDVTPGQIDAWVSTTITVTGENFILTPTVRINDTTIPDVEWVDEHTLRINLPAGLAPGIYTLWVINPGEQAGVLPNGLRVGKSVFLPSVHRP